MVTRGGASRGRFVGPPRFRGLARGDYMGCGGVDDCHVRYHEVRN